MEILLWTFYLISQKSFFWRNSKSNGQLLLKKSYHHYIVKDHSTISLITFPPTGFVKVNRKLILLVPINYHNICNLRQMMLLLHLKAMFMSQQRNWLRYEEDFHNWIPLIVINHLSNWKYLIKSRSIVKNVRDVDDCVHGNWLIIIAFILWSVNWFFSLLIEIGTCCFYWYRHSSTSIWWRKV